MESHSESADPNSSALPDGSTHAVPFSDSYRPVCDGVYSPFQTGAVSGFEYHLPVADRAFGLVFRENLWSGWCGLGISDRGLSVVRSRISVDSQAVCLTDELTYGATLVRWHLVDIESSKKKVDMLSWAL